RGLDPELAHQVAQQLMEHDALGAHARDDIGISQSIVARPFQAAYSSAAAFSVGAVLPLLVAWAVAGRSQIASVALASLLFLAVLGGAAAHAGGARILTGVIRVVFWGSLAMLLTALVGRLFGVVA
ncbi:MAG: VIT1/CCC1 transporter family protein, partial [Woeseia sp.]